jgi:hypothetical protein
MEKKIYQDDMSSDSSSESQDFGNRRRIFRRSVLFIICMSKTWIWILKSIFRKVSVLFVYLGHWKFSLSFIFITKFRQINAKMNPTKSNQIPIASLAKLNIAGHSSGTIESEKITLIVDDTRFLIDICTLAQSRNVLSLIHSILL